MITADSPWRRLGNVTPEFWRARLVSLQSPIAAEWQSAYDAAYPHTALALAMMEVESRYFTRFNDNTSANKNPLNLRPPTGGGYLAFDTLTDGIRAWRDRITDPQYKGGVYDKTDTILELVERYAPANDNNDPSAYAAVVAARVTAWLGTDAAPTVQSEGANAQMSTPATIDYSRLPVPVIIDLIGEDQPFQNPGIAITPTSGTWHETANEGNGADALMHQRYINNGCPDENGNPTKTSWHFTADEDRIVQHLALNRAAWHGGDSATGLGPSVYSIAVECCVNRDGNLAKAQENVAALFGLLRAEGIIKDVYQHNKWSGKDCPRKLRNGVTMSWATAQAKISGYAAKYAGQDAPQPSPIWWKPGDDWGPQTRTHDGAIAWAFLGEVTAKRNVPIRRDAHKDAAVVYHLKAGSRVRIVGTHVAANKVRWAFIETEPGKYGRAVLSAFNPYRWPTV